MSRRGEQAADRVVTWTELTLLLLGWITDPEGFAEFLDHVEAVELFLTEGGSTL